MRTMYRMMMLALVLFAGAAVPPHAAAQSEGIKVHGDWVIDVVNPDGSLASHNEFKNALFDGGKQILASLLTGSGHSGKWQVAMGGPLLKCGSGDCVLSMSNNTLSTSLVGKAFVLTGHITVTAGIAITTVLTRLEDGSFCDAGVPCDWTIFSGKDIAPLVLQLQPEQIVHVKVTYTFQ